jgi:hypothetical protein
MVAVPAVVSDARPRMAESAQRVAVASQNSTTPRTNGDPLLVTVAVSVTAVPAVTSGDETLKVVTVVARGVPALREQVAARNIRTARTAIEPAEPDRREAAK